MPSVSATPNRISIDVNGDHRDDEIIFHPDRAIKDAFEVRIYQDGKYVAVDQLSSFTIVPKKPGRDTRNYSVGQGIGKDVYGRSTEDIAKGFSLVTIGPVFYPMEKLDAQGSYVVEIVFLLAIHTLDGKRHVMQDEPLKTGIGVYCNAQNGSKEYKVVTPGEREVLRRKVVSRL